MFQADQYKVGLNALIRRESVGQANVEKNVVIPIARGKILKDLRRRPPPEKDEDESNAARRLIQCLEMMAELTREVVKKR